MSALHPPSGPVDPFEMAARAAQEIAVGTGVSRHDVMVVLGSGLSPVAPLLGTVHAPLDLTKVSGFAPFTAHGHRALAWSVPVGGRHVLIVAGRRHIYEGLGPHDVAHSVRTAVASGCGTVVLTCAAGGIRADLTPGTVAIITDHLNLTGLSPLTGIGADHPMGAPFVDLNGAYSPRLAARVHQLQPNLARGVYAHMVGPHLETPAEITMLARAGADMVGMSVALETIAARHVGAEVCALAVITNPAAGLGPGAITVEEMSAAAAAAVTSMATLLNALLRDPELVD